MRLSQRLFPDRQRTPQQRFRFRVPALHSIEFRQIVQACRRLRMRLSQRLFPDRQRTPQQRMVGGEIALPTANSELYVTVSRYTAPQCMVICD